MDRFLHTLVAKAKNIFSQSNHNNDEAIPKDDASHQPSGSPACMALENIRRHVPHGVNITVPDIDIGDIRVASYIGEHYTSVFPFLVACRGAALHSECVVYGKTVHYARLKRTAETLQNLGAIEIAQADDEEEMIYFILRDSTLLDLHWITGYVAKLLTKNFQGMPLQYVLHAHVQKGDAAGSFDALAVSGQTLFALRLVTFEPHGLFFERLHALAQALDVPDSRIVLPVLPQAHWRHIIEKLRARGYSACEFGAVSDVLQRLRREEVRRHRTEQKRAAIA